MRQTTLLPGHGLDSKADSPQRQNVHTKFRETSRILQTSRVNRCGTSLTNASSWANLSNSRSFRVGTGLALLISKREARERNDKAMSGMEATKQSLRGEL